MPNAAFAKFQSKRATATAARPRQSRFAGVRSAEPRNPYLQPGSYLLRVLRTEESSIAGKDPWFLISVEVLTSDVEACPPGYKTSIGYCTSSKASPTSFPRIKAFAVAASGFDSDEEYDAAEAEANDGAEGVWIDQASAGADVFNDQIVQVYVSRGNEITDANGNPVDFYREYSWAKYQAEETPAG